MKLVLLGLLSLLDSLGLSLLFLSLLGSFLGFGYGMLFVMGFFTLITEWKKIHCPKWKAVFHLFTFPLFMLTYLPISLVAFFTRVEWQPIVHKHAMNTEDIENYEKNDVEKAAISEAKPADAHAEEKDENTANS